MPGQKPIELDVLLEVSLGSRVGQCRAAPVCLGAGGPRAFLVAWCADFDVDPYVEMFFFPRDTLKLAVFDLEGRELWRRDLGPGVVPGAWFVPVLAFDLDGDGADDIWFVNNLDAKHPLSLASRRLERLDARTGRTTGQWPWPGKRRNTLSSTFRNFLIGGRAGGEPVLVTAQGTYGDMALQGWRPDMTPRWEHRIPADSPGARGSHMCPVTDLDGDGVEEVMWGERCIELGGGRELFCADRDCYRGHSDVVQPVLDRETDRWFIYTCREGDPAASPRVALYDDHGERIWGHLEEGHIDMGWVAHLGDGGRPVATAIRIAHKTCGPDGRFHEGVEEFAWDALTGEPLDLGFSTYRTLPVDLNGDGLHELVRGIPGGDGEVLDRRGNRVGAAGGPVAMACRFMDHAGEQVLSYRPDGTLQVWADRNAEDSEAARARYAHPYYAANARLTASGSNLRALGGL